MLQRDLARKPLHAPRERRQSHARLGQREQRVLGRDHDVAGEHDLETAAHRQPVDRGDHRLRVVEARREATETGGRPFEATAGRLELEVVAGAEGLVAPAGHDRDPQLGVCDEIVERT
jgi:hypothetical protein